jgi:undecaprenyl pyrophosphate phosphatase UppP
MSVNENEGKDSSEAMKWVSIGTEIPIMVAVCAYVGYIVGKKFGPTVELIGIVVGGLVGFILGMVSVLMMTGFISRKKRKTVKNIFDNMMSWEEAICRNLLLLL